MSLEHTLVATGPRVTPVRLLGTALGCLLLAGLTTAIYPHLLEHGAPGGLVSVTQGLGLTAAVLTFVFAIAAIVRRLAR